MKTTKVERDSYGAILIKKVNSKTLKKIAKLFGDACKAKKIDEHGNWDFGAEFDKAGRGYAINWDLYAYGFDFFSKRLLIVIQIRKWEKRSRNGYANVRKSYFLIGKNEDNSTFAHCVESRVIHSAISKNKDVIRAVQDWIFQCDYLKIIRQGDIALVPVKKIEGELLDKKEITLQKSHFLIADEIRKNESLYVVNPRMKHIPIVHPDIAAEGIYKIAVGQRRNYWDFAAPTID